MKLALGTVQFGLDYGISNSKGVVSNKTASRLLEQAELMSINILDTAAMYGKSEEVLGQLTNKRFKIVTKLAIDTGSIINVSQSLKESLSKLQRPSIYGLLLHNADVLKSSLADEITFQLAELKAQELVQKIGMSLYFPEQIKLFEILKPDIIQIPLNVLDQRFLQDGLLTKMKEQGIEIHVRSAFLQGLLLMSPKSRSDYFSQFNELNAFDKFVNSVSYSRLEICLDFLKSIDEIDRVVVGCCSASELAQINKAWHTKVNVSYRQLACTNNSLIIPSNWPHH
ncbi:Aldo/keto reductase family protein [Pseudoalteromonas sp. P1-30]|uniref:aldo/keto reductase n=1 Tax=Pseudoalteromonas sp. P1-30 TaxID=1723760 RepID=UPI0006D5D919|nr:aldo/keto reductase [Pseudoalteromonas sp. P1-30]KPV91360.1 Aldo/keto reductase family protein [Pseudoalteromonas sp. P1-30]